MACGPPVPVADAEAGAATAATTRPAAATANATRAMNRSGMSLPALIMGHEVTPK
jgi:hypothetical protein